ncbi:hypothetical protein D0N36_02600 [Hymenobacter lapidiphilus]|nr:hypothetical protein D0N36_02600 [Hymenobacter sp. CCM 8763]
MEQASLVKQIEEELSEYEYPAYRMAQRLNKGLNGVNQQLHILHNLLDKFYGQKQLLTDTVAGLKDVLAADESFRDAEYLREMIQEKQAQLLQLEKQSRTPHQKSDILRNTLSRLLKQEIAGFEFVFSRSEKVSCYVRLARRTIILTLPRLRELRENNRLGRKARARLRSLGFRYYDHQDKMLLFLHFADATDLQRVWEVFMKLAFEVFYYRGLEPTGEICYFEIE